MTRPTWSGSGSFSAPESQPLPEPPASGTLRAGGFKHGFVELALGEPVPIWAAAFAVLVAATGIALLDSEAGVQTWLDLSEESRISQRRIELLEHDVERLTAEIEALDSDELGLERAIREDLELARPGEWVVRFAASGATGQRPTGAGATVRFP